MVLPVSSFFGQSQQKSTRANANDFPTHLAVLAQLKCIPIFANHLGNS
jgi:hypothetical protein